MESKLHVIMYYSMLMLLLHLTYKFVSLQQFSSYCRKFFLSSSFSSTSTHCSSDRGKRRRGRRWRPKCWSYYRSPWNWTSILLVRRATQKLLFYLFDLFRISVEYIVQLCSPYSFSLLVFTLVNNLSHAPIVYY